MSVLELKSRIIVEGPNCVGKTTITKELAQRFKSELYAPFSGRDDLYDLWFSDPIEATEICLDILSTLPDVGVFDRYHLTPQTMVNNPLAFVNLISDNDLIVSLDAENETLKTRMLKKGQPETVDKVGYYRPHYNRLADNWNTMLIKVDNLTVDEIINMIVNRYSQLVNGERFKVKEGRSKKVFRQSNNLIIELKPSLDSLTYRKSTNTPGTEVLRISIHEKFVEVLKSNKVEVIDFTRLGNSSYTCEYFYSTPFEVIVKNRAVGTTIVDCPGLFTTNMPFSSPIVRFDYRCEPKDIAIPTDYVRNYGIDAAFIKSNSLQAFEALYDKLKSKGYELIDLCFVYGFNRKGELKIISEISPDGMRIRKDGESFDKDLFRNGFDDKKIISNWTKLLHDLI